MAPDSRVAVHDVGSEALEAQEPMKNRSLFDSFRCAFVGVLTALRQERHSQIAAVAVLAAAVVGFVLHLPPVEFVLLLLVSGLVLAAEMLNTAIEATIDLAAPYIDPLAGKAKDIAAGAVLVTIVIAVVTSVLILVPRIAGLLVR